MRNRKLKLKFLCVVAIAFVLFFCWPYFKSFVFAEECRIRSVIFYPSTKQINTDTWFNQNNRPQFTVKITGNSFCGGKTLPSVALVNTMEANDDIEDLNDVPIMFDSGSNEISLTFLAGEEGCSGMTTFFRNDCQLQLYINAGYTSFWSADGDMSDKLGGLDYDCYGSCSPTKPFDLTIKLLGIQGGKIGRPTQQNSICAYVAENGVYACIKDSNQKAAQDKCSEVAVCQGKNCKVIDPKNCGFRAFNYACVATDGKYACSPGNKSDCSDTSVCSGKQCLQISPQQCGQSAGGPGVGPGGGTPVTTQYVFNLTNPIGVENFQDLINIIGKWIFNLAIPIAVIIIIYAGVLMLTSGGVPARFQKGAKALWYAVIGLAIVLIGKGFVTLIQSILSLKNK